MAMVIFTVNQIHGNLKQPQSVIFGYGDELDDNYKSIVDKNENKFLGNIKSIKYLEADTFLYEVLVIIREPLRSRMMFF